MKKPVGSVRFRFYKQKTEPKLKKTGKKTEPNQKNRAKPEKPSQNRKTEPKPSQNRENRAKTGKTEPNRFEPVFALKNRTETGQFDLVSVQFRFFFKFDLVIFFDKNRTEPKMITTTFYFVHILQYETYVLW